MKRYSKKREAILDKIKSTTTHPTAEWVYEELKSEFPDLSLATVYRNIASFLEEGDLVSVGVIDSKEHFDGNALPHAHFICDKCGSIIDLIDYPLPDFDSLSCCKAERCELTFHGMCNKCL